MKIIRSTIAVGYLFYASTASASCGSRPGTPNHTAVKVGRDGVTLLWQNRASEDPVYYDVEVYSDNKVRLFNYSGVRDNPTMVTRTVLAEVGNPTVICGSDKEERNGQTIYCEPKSRQFAEFARFGQTASFKLPHLPLGTSFWFHVRARTEAGTQGCVSKQWSAPTHGSNYLMKVR